VIPVCMQGTEIQCTTHNGCCAHGLVVVHPNVQSGRSHELHCAKAAVTVEAELDLANCGSQDCGCESQLLLEYLSSASTDAKSASVITPTAPGGSSCVSAHRTEEEARGVDTSAVSVHPAQSIFNLSASSWARARARAPLEGWN
jgi:hypothetical protein